MLKAPRRISGGELYGGLEPSQIGFKNCKVIGPSDDIVEAYNWLKSTDRDAEFGVASATNRRVLVLTPGKYIRPKTSILTLDTEYIDLYGMGFPALYGESNEDNTHPMVKQTALDVRISNITFHTPQSANGWVRRGLEIYDKTIKSGSTGMVYYDEDEERWKLGQVSITGVAAGDSIEFVSGTGLLLRRSYKITGVSGYIQVENLPQYEITNLSYVIRRYNAASRYENLRIINGYHVWGYTGSVFGEGHLGGTWINCRADGPYAWRVTSFRHLYAEMYNCTAGEASFGGDGCPTGGTGTDNTVWSYVSGKFYNCHSGDTGFGGCQSFGSPITEDAEFYDCTAGDRSFAMGRECNGKFYRCVGGQHCFGGYSREINSLKGKFTGYAEDCDATGSSFGGGHAESYNSGTLVRCSVLAMEDAMYLTGAKIRDTTIQVTGTNKNCVFLNDSNSHLQNDTLIANGTGKSITSGAAQNVAVSHCRMNTDFDTAYTITNLIGTPGNVIDSDVIGF